MPLGACAQRLKVPFGGSSLPVPLEQFGTHTRDNGPRGSSLFSGELRSWKRACLTPGQSQKENMDLKKEVKFGENTLSLETGKMAKQADGSVVLRYGDTIILVTAVSAKEKKDVDCLA